MKKVFVLGAASSIGHETCRLWAVEGAKFYLVDKDESRLGTCAQDLKSRGASGVESLSMDLREASKHGELFSRAESFLGEIDIVFLAYGILGDQAAAAASYEETYRNLDVNLLSPISILTLAANKLEAQGKGVIAAISSVAGDRGRQSNYIYGTAKGGLTIFLQGLRNRLAGKGVHVLTIKPGFVDTPMTAAFKKGPLFVGPGVIAAGIVRAVEKRRNTAYLPWFWLPIMLIIRHIPEAIFKKMKL